MGLHGNDSSAACLGIAAGEALWLLKALAQCCVEVVCPGTRGCSLPTLAAGVVWALGARWHKESICYRCALAQGDESMFETKSQVPCSAMRVKTAYPPKKKGYAAAVSLLPFGTMRRRRTKPWGINVTCPNRY